MLRRRAGWVLVAALVSSASFAEPDIVFGIPLKPDPPIAVDGSLGDWVNVPNVIALTDAAQAVWGSGAWRSNEDLSGTARLAWRLEHLYIAVDVVDDVLSQSQRGADLWRGDHVELYLDAAPDLEPDRDSFGAGQFQLAFSPGNFQQTGDPLTDCAPEAYCYRPDSGSIEGALVAAVRTANGYSLEAAIPWRALGIEVPSEGIPFRFELAISDTDSSEARQETLMATSSAEWAHTRSRLRMACLAGTDGVAKPAARELPVFDAAELKQGAKQTFAFDAPPVPEGRIGVLVLMARLHTDAVAGYSQALRIRVNGTAIDAPRMLNKPLRVKSRGGQVYTMAAGDRFSTYYAPDFTSPDTHSYYGLLDGIRPCLFEFDVTDLLKAGENAIEIEHASDNAVQNPMHVADARLAFRMPTPPAAAKAGPPTGPLPVIEPQAAHETRYTAKTLPDNAIEVTVGADTFVVESQFSTPKPEWVHGSCDYFKHERFIEQLPETIVVRDTFTNLSTENLGIMHRYQAQLGDRLKRVWLAGLDQPALSGSTASEQNPTTFAATENGGIGFVALGDVFRIHVNNFAVGGAAGIGDNNLVLKPGGTYTAEWAIVPCETPSYWSFLNATRRLMNVNFTIDGGFAFLRGDPLTEEWTDEQVADFIRFKDPLYVCASITYPRYKGRYTHGTSFQLVDHDNY
ncbi:MAG: Carb-bd dom fam9 protein, partial [Candidatus Hydrogenedentes bacterium]|nr:Carb-bd dom fam9 protein [Candidatus Hydrogenedentota bacterium]